MTVFSMLETGIPRWVSPISLGPNALWRYCIGVPEMGLRTVIALVGLILCCRLHKTSKVSREQLSGLPTRYLSRTLGTYC
jgi:hypothetical protein